MLRLIFLLIFSVASHADTLSITDGLKGEKYPGKFIWTDLVTTDPERAAEFYSALFGWQISAYDEDYQVVRNQGRLIGGMARNQAEGDDVRSRWISFVSSQNFDATHEKLIAAGAEVVLEPTVVRERGELGIYMGPDGGVFGVLDSAEGDPQERGAGLGDWIWIELWSKDPAKSADFYDDLGYSVTRNWASPNDNDRLLVAGEYARGGIVEGHPEQKQSAWLLYVRVAEVEATLARAGELGGQVMVLQGDANSTGNVALVQDPTGGVVAVYQHAEVEEVEE